jgi:hypothetical protein
VILDQLTEMRREHRDDVVRLETKIDAVHKQALLTNGRVSGHDDRFEKIEQDSERRDGSWERWKDRMIPVAGSLFAVIVGALIGVLAGH